MEIIAHRGASHDAPENTLAAMRLAWEQGADAIECDVHLTRDGELAVMHDDDTERTAGERHVVADATLAELRQCDVGRWKDPKFSGEKIPTLDEVLALVPPGKRAFIEIKGGPAAVDPLLRTFARSGLAPQQLVVISFDFETVRIAKARLPAAPACWIIECDSDAGRLPAQEILARVRAARLDGLDLESTWPIDSVFVQQTRRAGIKLYVWTLDDPARARDLIAVGIDGIATNRPGWLRVQLAT
jgi:glycerophosphoryl diester phosphodiesterase